jgi:hypothetical protein
MDRFWSKAKTRGDCLLWTAARFADGYGIFKVHGRMLRAHRFAFELVNGPIPEGMFVLHRCDNPACVRPEHLFLGTARDNTRDMMAKGRHSPPPRSVGEANPGGGKLTATEVRQIRRKYNAGGYTLEDLAAEYGVSFGMVGHIVKRRAWKHVV